MRSKILGLFPAHTGGAVGANYMGANTMSSLFERVCLCFLLSQNLTLLVLVSYLRARPGCSLDKLLIMTFELKNLNVILKEWGINLNWIET